MSIASITPVLLSTLQRTLGNTFTLFRTPFNCVVTSQAVELKGLYGTPIRTYIRYHFPRPSERRRIKRHGWWKRMSTPEGRKILMRRILKGRHVYSH